MRLSITVAIVATVVTVGAPLTSVDVGAAGAATLPLAGQAASAAPTFRFPTAVSSNGRYFVDQVGDPIPLFVDHQWNLIARAGEWDETGVGTTTPQAVFEGYAAMQAANGFNAVLVLAISSAAVQPANADGSTWDGIVPFGAGGIGDLNEPYWSRVDAFIDAAAAQGLTVILNLVSSYTLATGQAMNGLNTTNGTAFGTAIGNRYKDRPNLIYQFGVDYFGFHEDDFAAITDAIQATGDTHLVTVQYMAESNTRTDSNNTTTDTFGTSTDISYDEIYSYNANYVEVERAYQLSSPEIRPTFMANGHYDQSSTTSTYDWHLMADLMGWALTSGSKGMFYGSEDTWQWNSGAYKALPDLTFPNGPWGATITWFAALDGWQNLVPDFGSAFITSSRGTKLAPITPGGAGDQYNNTDPQNDYLTGAVTPDGTLALLYTPTARTITINTAKMVASYTAKWVDPYNGSVTAATSSASSYPTPGTNSDGDDNWYLLIEESSESPPDTTITGGPAEGSSTDDNAPTFTFTASEAGSTFQCRVDGAAFAACTTPFTTAALADGSHTFEVRATDPAGNTDPTPASRTFSVDATPPDTTITGGPAAGSTTDDNAPTFTFTSSEAGSTFQCRVDGAAFAACTTPFTTAALADGEHTFEVRAIDGAGNVDPTPASRTFTVSTVIDNQPPDTSITGGPAGGSTTNDNAPTFTFTSSEAGSTFQCRVDNAAFAACTTPFTTAALADGQHTFEVRAIDGAGNTDPTPASRTFTVSTVIDNQPPDTSITGGPAGGSTTNDNAPTFTFTSSEAGSTFQCRVDNAAFAACTTPFTTAALSDGEHTFEVRAIEGAGNVDPTPASRTFSVDATPPDTTITGGPAGGSTTDDNAPTFTFTSSEAGSTFQCRVDAAAFAACTTPFTTAALADGQHTFEVRAIDGAGNTDPTPASRTFTVSTVIDNQPPDTSITGGPAGGSSTDDNAPTFTFTSSEAGSTFQCRVDGAAFAACTTPFTTAALADGEHTFEVRATDPAGNTDPTPASRTFSVDATPPDTTITGGPAGSTTDDNAPTFTFTSSEAGSTFQCRVDAAAFAACTTPFTTAALADGEHTFEVRAIDGAGNTDPTPASRTFTVSTVIDNQPPDTSITGGPAGGSSTDDNAPTFTFTSSEAGSTFQCRVDAAAFAACTTPFTTAALADGEHTFEVRATDPAGNTDPTPASRTFSVDATPPDTTITGGPAGGSTTDDNAPTFTFTSSEAGSTFQCRVDAAAFAACTTPFTTAALADGEHTFEVRAIDSSGNVDPTPASRTFTVDTDEPDTSITGGPAAGSTTDDNAPTFTFTSSEAGSTFQCRVDAAAFAACTTPFTTAALADGEHTFEVRATDPAGNTDPTPASRTFSVDATPPDTSITGGPAGSTTDDNAPTFTFTSSEAGSTFQCRVDAAAFAACTTPFTTAALADGEHTFEVRAIDGAGNVDPTPASRTFTVSTVIDNQPPDTSITGGPAGGSTTNDNAPTFTFTSSEAGSTFQCRVDAAAFAACTTPFTTAALADGEHTFEVRATDSANNTDPTPASWAFTVDTDEPDTSITGGPAAGSTTNDNAPTFTFTSSEAGSTFQCRVDNAAFAACTTPFTTAALSDGEHTFEVRAIEGAGNVDPTPASRTFSVDATPPDTTITGGPAGGSTTDDNAPTFTFTSSEAGSTFQCRVDAAAFAACTTPFTTAALADGEHTFEVRAIDSSGNVDPTPASRTFTVDTDEPDTSITGGPAAGSTTDDNAPTFTFTSSEAGSTFQCRVDAAAFAACTTPFTTAGLADGEHTFEVRATDPAGNTDPTPASRTFSVDATPPDTSITGGPGAGSTTDDNSPTFTFTSSEAGSTFQCRVDAAAFAACTTPFTTAALADGEHTFEVRAIDGAGNVDPTPASRTFTVSTVIDNQPPDTSITGGPAAGSTTNDNAPTFTFTSSEAGSTFQCRVDAAAFAACTTPFTTAALADGEHTFEVRAIDPANNTDPTPASWAFTVDTVEPDTSITGGPAAGSTTDDNAPTFTFTSSEAGSTFQCRVDNAAFAACTTPFTTAALADGEHTFEVRAIDPAGNVDPTPASRTFSVDATPPDTTITGGPAAGSTTNDNAPTFTFTSSEAGSTFQCRVDNAAFAACTTPFTTGTLADGTHAFSVRATDALGNTDATPATAAFTVSTTPAATCDGKAATIVGTPGDDSLVGTSGADVIVGLGGDDILTGGGGNDTICGNAGNDHIVGGGGNDTVDGGDGNDTVDGGDGNDTVDGGDGNDTVDGGDGNDTVDGGDGNDIIIGAAGDDWLTGGSGDDTLTGACGDDTLAGNGGDDTLAGNGGDDHLDGGPGHDSGNGGAGTNVVINCEACPWPSQWRSDTSFRFRQ